jgi:hypothetical protein
MAIDTTGIESQIDANLPDNNKRQNKAAVVRYVLKVAVRWVRDAINGNLSIWYKLGTTNVPGLNSDPVHRTGKVVVGRDYTNGKGAALEATSAWVDNLNGYQVSPHFTITSVSDNLAPTRYFAIGELPAQTGGTYDFAQIEFMGKPWDSNGGGSPLEISLWCGNRGGFRYQYTTKGDANGTGLICQQMNDGRTVIYMVTDNSFKAISGRVANGAQIIVYQSPTYQSSLAGLGTEVFNSTKPTVYKPMVAFRQRFFTVPVINCDGGFPPASLNEAGAAQLSLSANWIPGSSELGIVHSNAAGGGISFWQMTAANVKKLLMWMTANGDMILGGNGQAPSEKLHVIGHMLLNGILKFPNVVANRKISLHNAGVDNEHQFFGFGVNNYVLRYQIPDSFQNHIFYAASSAATSNELMRIQGDGKVGIGRTNLAYPFDVGGNNPADSIVAQFINLTSGSGGNGSFIRIAQVDVGNWDLGVVNTNHFVIRGWNSAGAIVERARFTPDGRFLIGQTTANDRDLFQVNGSISGKVARQSGDAQPSEVPLDSWRVVHNTSTNQTRLVVNIGGQIKSMLFQ